MRRNIEVMGTVATVEIVGAVDDGLIEVVFDWLREVDNRFSTYRPDSEVNRLDRGELRPEECSDDLRHVL